MKIYVSFDGDHIGRMIGRAALADKPEEVRRLSQDIERGNQLWQSWAEAQGGNVISMGGDEGRLEVEADHLPEIPKLRQQYKACVDSTVSVGVGMKLSEADKALLAAKLQGGDRIQLYAPEVEEILANAQKDNPSEGQKIVEEYLDPSTGLKKADPALNQGSGAGATGPSQPRPAAPQAPMAEASEHSEAEALRGQIENQPDFESVFHRLAQQQAAKEASQPQANPAQEADKEKLRGSVVKILQQLKGRGDQLAVMRQQDPEMYQSIMGLVQGMIEMARQVFPEGQAGQLTKAEDLVKMAIKDLKPGKTVRVVAPREKIFDYNHLLPPAELKQGARLTAREFSEDPTGQDISFHVSVQHPEVPNEEWSDKNGAEGMGAGSLYGHLVRGKYVAPHESIVHEKLRGRGLGMAMYEAAYAHAFHHHGVKMATGGSHSREADALHQKLTAKHGLQYEPAKENPVDPSEAGYQYNLKSEMEKGEDPDCKHFFGNGTKCLKCKQTKEDLDKAALDPGKTGRHNVVLPSGSQIDAGPSGAHKAGQIKITDPATGKTKWRQVRANMVLAPDGTPTSSRNPNPGGSGGQ